MTSVSRSTHSTDKPRTWRLSIEADTAAELLAEVAMLDVPSAENPVTAARACARLTSLPVIRWAEELQAKGYRDLGLGWHNGRWHAHFLVSA